MSNTTEEPAAGSASVQEFSPPGQALPPIIQGGMGAAVSNWRLARAVAIRGMLGVVSGTGIDQVLARRLQHGDPDHELRDALAAFPCQRTARRALDRFFIPSGKEASAAYKTPAMYRLDSPAEHQALGVLGAFVEVWLAKRHGGLAGINVLEKIALPNPSVLYGAMLAGADYVLVGAGIPAQIPGMLDAFARGEAFGLRVAVEGGRGEAANAEMHFDPAWVAPDGAPAPQLPRPNFLAIVSSPVIAQTLLKRANGSIEGFVVEGYTAGGHNAPPRGQMQKNERGEPIYGERDAIDLEKFRALGLPFWLAGGQGHKGALREAQSQGAAGIQVGTLFAFSQESGLDGELRERALEKARAGELCIFTDPDASPTGFPFKVVELEGTLSEADLYEQRQRVCDAGYLRRVCQLPSGEIGYRCPGEPETQFVAKGGAAEETAGRKCLCNALMANIGLAQTRRDGSVEGALLTAGDDIGEIARLLEGHPDGYTAGDVINWLQQ